MFLAMTALHFRHHEERQRRGDLIMEQDYVMME